MDAEVTEVSAPAAAAVRASEVCATGSKDSHIGFGVRRHVISDEECTSGSTRAAQNLQRCSTRLLSSSKGRVDAAGTRVGAEEKLQASAPASEYDATRGLP